MDLRFPGQWFQAESGLHQNWMRDYDPALGRYLQADPLGLVDGASGYGYALQNPGRWTDPYGLWSFDWYGNWGGPGKVNGQMYNPGHPGRPRRGRNPEIPPSPSSGWRESDRFPRSGEPGFIPPIDLRDNAYYNHDVCISECYREICVPEDLIDYGACVRKCDEELIEDPNTPWFEDILFGIVKQTR